MSAAQEDENWYSSDEEDGSKRKKSTSSKPPEEAPVPGLSRDAVKKLSALQIPSALANLFAGKATPGAPAAAPSGNQVTFNLLDFVKKGPQSKQQSSTPTSPSTEILDSPLSPTNEEFKLIECIHEPGRKDPRQGKERKDKSDMRFRVLRWKDNKYSFNDPEDRPSLPPIELTTPTELKSQPSFPKKFPPFVPAPQLSQGNVVQPQAQMLNDARTNRPQDPRLARMQSGNPDENMNAPPKDPRINRDPRSMAPNMPEANKPGDLTPNALLPTPNEVMRFMGPRPPTQDGILPFPPRGPRPPLGPMPRPPFMQGQRPMGMGPGMGGPPPLMSNFPPDLPPPDMIMPPRGPPRGPLDPRAKMGQGPPFNRAPMMGHVSDGPNNSSSPMRFPGGPGPVDQSMNRMAGPGPGDPRSALSDRRSAPNDPRIVPNDPRSAPNDPRTAPKDPRSLDPRQAPQDPRNVRPAPMDPRDPRKAAAENRDPRLSRQLSNNPSVSPLRPENLPPQDIDERLNIPKPQDVDLRQPPPNQKMKLPGFSIPKLQKRPDVAEADTTVRDKSELGGSGGILHRKVPSAHHSQPHAVPSFDVGSKPRTPFPSGDPRTRTGRNSPDVPPNMPIPPNGEGDSDMAAAIAQLAEEPEIQLKDMFKTQDPTASPFC